MSMLTVNNKQRNPRMSIKITKKNLVHLTIASINLIYQVNFMLPAQAHEKVKIDPEFSQITHESCHSYEYENQKLIDCVTPINIPVEPFIKSPFKVENPELEHRKIIKKTIKNENSNLENQPVFSL